MRRRDQNCGLTGKDHAPIDELRKAKQCMKEKLDARLADLRTGSLISSTTPNPTPNSFTAVPDVTIPVTKPPPNSAASAQQIIIKPTVQSGASADTGETGPQDSSAPQTFSFSASANRVSDIADCSAASSSQEDNPVANTPLNGSRLSRLPLLTMHTVIKCLQMMLGARS